jgi:hypothetical protein
VENLLEWLSGYSNEDPLLVACWFHHRFTQIHPYQDGNGRVARALTTLILLRAELLPLVIDRDLRVPYIKALELADRGDLTALVEMFASLEKNTILQALSVDVDAEVSRQESVTSAVIESLADRFNKRKIQKQAELRKVNDIARTLRESAKQIVANAFSRLESALLAIGKPDIHYTDGGPDHENSHWYKHEVITSAQKAGKFANFAENHYFLKASIRALRERLVFVTSFHHVGRELTGIMEATAFARLESFEDSDDRRSVEEDFFVCSIEPFVFTYRTKLEDLQQSFAKWIDAALAVAVKEYGDRL